MALLRRFVDRVKETSTTTGTGAFTLDGAASGEFFSFGEWFEGGEVTYCIEDATNGAWEVGRGIYSGGVLTRSVVYDGSDGIGSLVSFGAGTKTVFATLAADEIVHRGLAITLSAGIWNR